MYLCTVFGLYSALRYVCSMEMPTGNAKYLQQYHCIQGICQNHCWFHHAYWLHWSGVTQDMDKAQGWVRHQRAYMSKSRKMRCLSCGYETEVYDGRGLFQQEIIPMECLDCHTVQNIVVGGIIGEVAPSFNSEAGRLCPKCSSMNIRRWNRHTCPKCGGEMVAEGKDEFWTWSIADIIH